VPANWRWLAASITTLALLSGIVIWRFFRQHVEPPLPLIEVVPLVGSSGFQGDPAFSPDGNHLAFVLGGKTPGIHTMMVGGEKTLQLTNNFDHSPRWSPDGRQIAFWRPSEEGISIFVIASYGGTEHRLYSGPSGSFPHFLDWSPDGKSIAFSQSHPDKTH